MDPNDLIGRALESLSGGLAQLRHVRGHMKDQVKEDQKKILDEQITKLGEIVQAVARLEVNTR